MIKQLYYEIQIDYLDTKQFYLYANYMNQSGRKVPLAEWRPLLFSWHTASFYGTSFPELNGGVLLSPWEALQFFSDSSYHSSLFSFSYSDRVEWLSKWAPVIFSEIQSGQFVPDFEQWQAEKFGWKLLLDEDKLADIDAEASLFTSEFIRSWISNAISAFIEQNEELSVLWKDILDKYPLLLMKETEQTAGLFNEETWLEKIGWQEDKTPFTVELRLSEPVQDQEVADDEATQTTTLAVNSKKVTSSSNIPDHDTDMVTIAEKVDAPEQIDVAAENWSLDIILRDKNDANHWYVWDSTIERVITAEMGSNTGDKIPSEWLGFLDKIRKSIELWCHIVPWLKATNQKAGIIRSLREDEAWSFLTEASIQLAEAGVEILLPSWWQEIRAMNPKLKIQLRSSVGSAQQSLLGLQAIGDFDWKFATGNSELDETEFLQLVAENRRLVKVNGKWMKLDPAFIKQVKEIMNRVKKEGLSFQDIMAQELTALDPLANNEDAELDNPFSQIQIGLNKHLEKLIFQLHNITSVPTIEVPTSLNGELRPYQKQGVEWLLFLRKFGFGACLADDMGLGSAKRSTISVA